MPGVFDLFPIQIGTLLDAHGLDSFDSLLCPTVPLLGSPHSRGTPLWNEEGSRIHRASLCQNMYIICQSVDGQSSKFLLESEND